MQFPQGAFSKKDILITGGTGFIGSNLVRELIKENANIFVGIRKSSDLWRLENIKNKINLLEIDLQNKEKVNRLIQSFNPHYIFHFALPSYLRLKNAFDYHNQLNQTTGNLINLLNAVNQYSTNLNSFVHACSSTIYKWEKNHYYLSEKTSLDPATFRGMLKLNERNICRHFARKNKIPIKIGRIFRAYGPWDTSQKLIVTALNSIKTGNPMPLSNDRFKRDYIFIDDLIQGFLKMAVSHIPTGSEINFGSGKQYNAGEIIKTLEEILDQNALIATSEYPENPYDRGNFIADISLAKQKLGWQPKFSVKEGLKCTVDWYKNYFKWNL
ncbi:NAD-dependent epimerase/dehydratase family protein [Flexithrix dorotheae]|uniref:NAD-dependent epimerase/dehydratase family protein n=1 Tax=Flexithrix dorotheae TaxID=70993 RepID=UPI000362D6BF|nr:NAD(P)-dependent oxidoreductase [Flexithrix dorotheae]